MIRKLSKKRAKQMREYEKVRDAYLYANPFCLVKNCNQMANQVHHMKGRIGMLLTDVRYFLAVCPYHHAKIEAMPLWAKEMGYSLNRL